MDDIVGTFERLEAELVEALTKKLNSGKATAADLNVARQLCSQFSRGNRVQSQTRRPMPEVEDDDLPTFDD